MKNILNFFNKKTEYNQKKAELSPDAIAFVADEHKIYTKNNWFGGSGSGESTVVEYDDTELRNSIDTLSSRVDGLDTMTDQNVEEIVTTMIANIKSFVDGFTWEGMFDDTNWNRTMSSYILENLAINDDGNTVSYNQFYQAFKTLQGVVQDIEVASSSDEGITTDTIQSMIARTIDGNTIINWVKNNQDVLSWLASGFANQVDQGSSFAQVYTADKTATDNAISALDDRVTTVEGTVGNNTSAIVQLNNAVANTMSSTDINAAITNATSALNTRVANLSDSMSRAITKDVNGNISVSANNISIESENLTYATSWNHGDSSTQVTIAEIEHPDDEQVDGPMFRFPLRTHFIGPATFEHNVIVDTTLHVTGEIGVKNNYTDDYQYGYTGIINGIQFINGICVGEAE